VREGGEGRRGARGRASTFLGVFILGSEGREVLVLVVVVVAGPVEEEGEARDVDERGELEGESEEEEEEEVGESVVELELSVLWV
jgi:hypothetical protein